MSLSAFIRSHHEDIIREFAAFAETVMPPGATMSNAELRDHAEEMLTAISLDIGTEQSPDQELQKSKGLGIARSMARSGTLHADNRIQHGFTEIAVLAEFRALRATVLRLYEESGASDLTEVRRFNEAVDEAITASMTRFVRQTNVFRDQFVGVLSHDLRTPLGAIMTGASLLSVPEDNPTRRARVAATILRSSQRMERMIGDLLDLTQAKLGGELPLNRQRTDLVQVCRGVIAEIHVSQPDVRIQFRERGHLVGNWDSDRLAQVLSNLLGNAIQHGEGTPITLEASEQGDSVTFTVHNGGAPIPPQKIPHLFEALSRGDSGGANAGHSIGFGLFIARVIVTAHGGEIVVSSCATLGTTFTVMLPKG